MDLRCITLNVKGLGDGWFNGRSQALIEGLRAYRADLICFQEAAIRKEKVLYHQARAIGEALGLENILFSPYGNPDEIISQDQGGVAIASRWPLPDARGRRLPSGHLSPSDARVAIFALLDSPGGRVGVITTHLSWRPVETETRLMQMGIILSELSRRPWGPQVERYILLGDLNAHPDEPVIQSILKQMNDVQMNDAYRTLHPRDPGHTWSTRNPLTRGANLPDRRVDYVFCDKSAKIRKCEIILDQPAPVFASDHYGVYAELEWP